MNNNTQWEAEKILSTLRQAGLKVPTINGNIYKFYYYNRYGGQEILLKTGDFSGFKVSLYWLSNNTTTIESYFSTLQEAIENIKYLEANFIITDVKIEERKEEFLKREEETKAEEDPALVRFNQSFKDFFKGLRGEND